MIQIMNSYSRGLKIQVSERNTNTFIQKEFSMKANSKFPK